MDAATDVVKVIAEAGRSGVTFQQLMRRVDAPVPQIHAVLSTLQSQSIVVADSRKPNYHTYRLRNA